MVLSLANWAQPELDYDITSRPLIDDTDDVLSFYQPGESVIWLAIERGLFAVSQPGRHYELFFARSKVDNPLLDLKTEKNLRSFVQARHQYDHQLDGVSMSPPADISKRRSESNSEAAICRTRYQALSKLYRAIDFHGDFPRYEQLKGYDDQAIMDRAEVSQERDPVLVKNLNDHYPGRGFALNDGRRRLLFRTDKLHPVALINQPRTARDRPLVKVNG